MYPVTCKSGKVIMRKTDPNRSEEEKAAERSRMKASYAVRQRYEVTTPKGTEWDRRKCLTCDDSFWSESKAHRRCPRCQDALFGMEYQRRQATTKKRGRP